MFQPRGDRILVKPDPVLEHATATGIVVVPRNGEIVESAKQFGRTGTVVAVGPGKKDKKGNIHPLTVKEGDRIYFGEFIYQQFHDCYLMQEADVCGVIDARA